MSTLSQSNAFIYVVNDDLGALFRINFRMRIDISRWLIFYEKFSIGGLANVMIKCSNPYEQTVRANCICCLLSKIGYDQTMLVRTRRFCSRSCKSA